MGSVLPLIGAHWIARKESAKTIMLSQLAGFGILLGILVLMLLHHQLESTSLQVLLPTFLGILFSGLIAQLSSKLTRSQNSNTAIYLSIFLFFWALSQGFIGFFPGIESHHSAIYFGDIVTLTKVQCLYFTVGSGAALAYYLWFHKRTLQETFNIAVLRLPISSWRAKQFMLYSLFLIVLSVQFLGVLFTLSCLLIPSTMGHLIGIKSLRRHFLLCGSIGILAAGLGFVWSLLDSRLLTTPTIAILMVLFPVIGKCVFWAFSRCK